MIEYCVLMVGGLAIWWWLGKAEKRIRRRERGERLVRVLGTRGFICNIPADEASYFRQAADAIGYRIRVAEHAFDRFDGKVEGYVGVYSCEPPLRSVSPLFEEFIRRCPRFRCPPDNEVPAELPPNTPEGSGDQDHLLLPTESVHQ